MSNEHDDKTAPQPEQGPTQPEPKVIKRYSNRKLYDTERSKYVTLDEIAKMIKAGEEVTIIDNETKEDLTSVTLTQIIYEEEKRESRMPLGMLRNLIQTGGEALHEFFDKSLKTPVVEAQRSVEKGVEELKQSAIGLREAATRSVTDLTGTAKRMFAERKAEEFRKSVSAHLDELEDKLRTRIEDLKSDADGNSNSNDSESSEMLAAHKIDAHVTMLKERFDAMRQLVDELERLGHQHKN